MEEQLRSIAVTEVDPETRQFVGVFAPYNETIEYNGKPERYERGLFEGADLVDLYWNHGKSERGGDMPIGSVLEYVETEDGAGLIGQLYESTRGLEAHSLLKAGALNSLSAGFMPTQFRTEDDGTTVWEKAYLNEVSLVKKSAYPSAKISEVRSENTKEKEIVSGDTNTGNMTEVQTYDDSEIRSKVEGFERDLAVALEKIGENNSEAGSQYRSAGEFIKALAENDDSAKTEIRAYTGAVLADSHTSNDWKANLLTIVDRGRPVLNLFQRGPLGDHGNNIEYPKISGTTGDVAKQAAEGDNLAYLEVAVTTATAPVETYGGYSELSRQVIERSDVSYLDATLRFQAASYAKVTNAKVISTIGAATPQTGTSFTLSSATQSNFLDAVVDGVNKIDVNGLGAQADFILVSPDVWAKMVSVAGTQLAFDVNGSGGLGIGSANIRANSGSLAGLPIVVATGFAAKTFYVASSAAVTSWENSGAPVRLQDENIINLTKQFSLYGYLAVGVVNANGLVKATVA